MGERLLDAGRTIGQPKTVIEDLDLPNPVIRSHYGSGFLKQYVRDQSRRSTCPRNGPCN